MSPSLEAQKRALRRRLREAAAPPAAEAGGRAQRRALALPALQMARRVALYAARPDEVPTELLFEQLAQRGVERVFPRVTPDGLVLHCVEALSELVPGYRGVREPDPERPSVAPSAVEVFVVPGVGFDRRGGRLGRGGGHYDRLLASAPRATRVGLCFSGRLVERVPAGERDATMDVVVTELESVTIPGRRSGAGGGA